MEVSDAASYASSDLDLMEYFYKSNENMTLDDIIVESKKILNQDNRLLMIGGKSRPQISKKDNEELIE